MLLQTVKLAWIIRQTSRPYAAIPPLARETPPPCLLGATDRRADSPEPSTKESSPMIPAIAAQVFIGFGGNEHSAGS